MTRVGRQGGAESASAQSSQPPPEQLDVAPGAVADAMVGGSRLLALRASQYFFLFVASLVIARALGPELRAQYALPLALSGAVWTLTHLSLDSAALRALGRREASLIEVTKVLSASILVLGCLGAAMALAIGSIWQGPLLAGASASAILLGALMVPVSLAQQLTSTLLARVGALRAFGWASAISAALVLVLDLILIATSTVTPATAIGAIVAGGLVLDLALLVALSKHTGARGVLPGGSLRVVRLMVRAGLALHPAAIALFLIRRIDIFLVSLLASNRAVGLYSLAATLAEIMLLAAWTLVHAASKTQTDAEPDAAARYTSEFLRQSWILVAAAAGVLAAVSYPAITVLYGREWAGSVVPFVILCFGSVAFAIEKPARALLARVARPSIVVVPAVVGAAVNVVLNLALIPTFGITGAAVASLIAYWLYALLILRRFGQATGLPMSSVFRRPTREDSAVQLMATAMTYLKTLRYRGTGRRGG